MFNDYEIERWELLLEISTLYRKYDIGGKEFFVQNIQAIKKVSTTYLEDAWNKGAGRIKHDDIIKDAKSLSLIERQNCEAKVKATISQNKGIKNLLFSEFDPKKYKLDEENYIRHVRQLLAKYYLKQAEENYRNSFIKEKTRVVRKKFRIYTYIANFAFLGLSTFSLTPLYQEHYKYKQEVKEWRASGIANSPTVCLTRSGERYHNCYHYSKRNFEISLFEAVVDDHKTPCGTCNPPVRDFGEKPKSKYPNPYLISVLPLVLGLWGNSYAKKKIDAKVDEQS